MGKALIKEIFNKKTGELTCTIFPDALKIVVTYRLVKNTAGSSSDFSLEGVIGNGDAVRSYIMPDDKLIMEDLRKLPAGQARQLAFEYQAASLPGNKAGYLERSLLDGKARIFRNHSGLDQIFFDIGMIECGINEPEGA